MSLPLIVVIIYRNVIKWIIEKKPYRMWKVKEEFRHWLRSTLLMVGIFLLVMALLLVVNVVRLQVLNAD